MLPNSVTSVWPIYGGPARDDAGCVGIGIIGESARFAGERVPSLSVRLGSMTTGGTCSTGITRINERHRNTDEPALVCDLSLKIRKCPRMQDAPLAFSNSYPVTNKAKVFHRDTASGAFSLSNYLFGNHMVLVVHETRLATLKPIENTTSRTSASGLQSLSLPPTSFPNASDLASASIGSSIRVLGQVHKAEINPEPVERLSLLSVGNIHRHVQVPLSSLQDQIRLAAPKLKELALAISAHIRQMFYSAANRPDTHRGFAQLEIEDFVIVGDGAKRPEGALRVMIQLVRVEDLCDQTDNWLRGKLRKLSAKLLVKQAVHWKLLKLLRFPSQLRKPVAGLIHRLKSELQHLFLSWCRKKFKLDGQFQRPLKYFKTMNQSSRNYF